WKCGGVGLAPELYGEVQRAWAEQIGSRADEREVELTAEDLTFVRRRFHFQRMKAFDNPAPDFQIVAADEMALREGRWQLVLGEIHPDLSIWEHCFMAWCPDAEGLAREYREAGHAPAVMFGPTGEFGVHV